MAVRAAVLTLCPKKKRVAAKQQERKGELVIMRQSQYDGNSISVYAHPEGAISEQTYVSESDHAQPLLRATNSHTQTDACTASICHHHAAAPDQQRRPMNAPHALRWTRFTSTSAPACLSTECTCRSRGGTIPTGPARCQDG